MDINRKMRYIPIKTLVKTKVSVAHAHSSKKFPVLFMVPPPSTFCAGMHVNILFYVTYKWKYKGLSALHRTLSPNSTHITVVVQKYSRQSRRLKLISTALPNSFYIYSKAQSQLEDLGTKTNFWPFKYLAIFQFSIFLKQFFTDSPP